MYFNDRKVVYIDGKPYLVNESSDGPGVLAIMVFMVLAAVVSMVQSAYVWMLAHYGLMACLSIFGLITWIGWAKVHHELGELKQVKNIGKGFVVMALILLCFNTSYKGFAKSYKEDVLKTAIRGEWQSLDDRLELTVGAKTWYMKNKESLDRLEAQYTTRNASPEIIVNCIGKYYEKDSPTKPKLDSFKQTYFCQMQNDTLLVAEEGSQQYLLYVKR